MNKRQIIASLVETANVLDALAQYGEADVLTRVAQDVSNMMPDNEGMGDTGGDVDYGGPSNVSDSTPAIGSSNSSAQGNTNPNTDVDTLLHLMETINASGGNPTDEQSAELRRLFHAVDNGPQPGADDEDFASSLQNAGANVLN